jgi:CspA family cold shock protein
MEPYQEVISDKGFGFIQGEDRQEYFMHRSAVRDGSVFEQLREGQTVVFDAGRGDKDCARRTCGSLSSGRSSNFACFSNGPDTSRHVSLRFLVNAAALAIDLHQEPVAVKVATPGRRTCQSTRPWFATIRPRSRHRCVTVTASTINHAK